MAGGSLISFENLKNVVLWLAYSYLAFIDQMPDHSCVRHFVVLFEFSEFLSISSNIYQSINQL